MSKTSPSDIIVCQKLEKIFFTETIATPVLKGIDLVIRKGEFVTLVGPSGSGKTTLLNIIGTLLYPSKGTVLIDNENIFMKRNDNFLAKIRATKIGFIFQSFNLIPMLSVLENVSLPNYLIEGNAKKTSEKAHELLKLVGLEQRINYSPSNLSGGEKQRVAIARALINDPPILLADEPTGNLDVNTSNQIMQLLLQIHSDYHTTVLMVTHNLKLAEQSDRTIKIEDGVLIA